MTNDLQAELAALKAENRTLRVGGGATFEELEASGKAGGGRVYQFHELRSLPAQSNEPTAPPLVFIHVPKTAGTTTNHILMRNFRYRLDAYGSSFFPRYFPSEFVALVRPRLPDDTRRPVFFTGHIDITNDVFRYMPVAYVAITVLREPVARIVSHYRAESTLPNSPIGAEIRDGKMSLLDFFRRLYPPYQLQHEIFAPTSRDVGEALRNIESKVSLFGLQERFDEFAVMLAELLGLPDVVHATLNETSADAAPVSPSEIDEMRRLLADEVAFYKAAETLYRARVAQMPADFSMRVELYRLEKQEYVARRKTNTHAWGRFYA
jgi:Galactose-3-O-sulfotransferase